MLPSLRVGPRGRERVSDLHLFMTCVYTCWLHRGCWGACVVHGVDFLNVVVLWLAIFFLALMVHWEVVISCTEVTCKEMRIIRSPTMDGFTWAGTAAALVVLTATGVACLYELRRLVETVCFQREVYVTLQPVVDVGFLTPLHWIRFTWYRRRARASGHVEVRTNDPLPFIADLSWGDFLERLCAHIRENKNFGIAAHREFDALRAIQALMVYDNYIIALNESAWFFHGGVISYADERLLRALIRSMFDSFNNLSSTQEKLHRVRMELLYHLAMHIVTYPFAVTFYLMKVLVKNAALARSDMSNYFARDWAPRATWSFRLYNEVPHVHAARMIKGRKVAIRMTTNLQPDSQWKRFGTRVASAIVVVALSLSIINTALLLSSTILGQSIVWWLSAGLVFYTALHVESPVCREYMHWADLDSLVSHIHYQDPEWSISGDAFVNAITWDFFHTRLYMLVGAVLQVIFTPFIIFTMYVDDSLPQLVDFVTDFTVRIDGFGSVVRGSAFDVSDTWDPHVVKTVSSGGRATLHEREDESGDGTIRRFSPVAPRVVPAMDGFVRPKCSEKVLRSIASFAGIYRTWEQRVTQAYHAAVNDSTSPPLDLVLGGVSQQPSIAPEDGDVDRHNSYDSTASSCSQSTTASNTSRELVGFEHLAVNVEREKGIVEPSCRFRPSSQHWRESTALASVGGFVFSVQKRVEQLQQGRSIADSVLTSHDRQQLYVSTVDVSTEGARSGYPRRKHSSSQNSLSPHDSPQSSCFPFASSRRLWVGSPNGYGSVHADGSEPAGRRSLARLSASEP